MHDTALLLLLELMLICGVNLIKVAHIVLIEVNTMRATLMRLTPQMKFKFWCFQKNFVCSYGGRGRGDKFHGGGRLDIAMNNLNLGERVPLRASVLLLLLLIPLLIGHFSIRVLVRDREALLVQIGGHEGLSLGLGGLCIAPRCLGFHGSIIVARLTHHATSVAGTAE